MNDSSKNESHIDVYGKNFYSAENDPYRIIEVLNTINYICSCYNNTYSKNISYEIMNKKQPDDILSNMVCGTNFYYITFEGIFEDIPDNNNEFVTSFYIAKFLETLYFNMLRLAWRFDRSCLGWKFTSLEYYKIMHGEYYKFFFYFK